MPDQSTYNIDTRDLEIGILLPFDLRGPDGSIVHKAGLPVTNRLLERLEKLGVTKVSVRGAKQPVEDSTSILLGAYDPEVVSEITSRINSTVEQLSDTYRQLLSMESVDANTLEASLGGFIEKATQDTSAVIGILAGFSGATENDVCRLIAERSTKLSYLVTVTAMAMEYSQQDAVRAGMVGLLCDVSLLLHPEWFGSNGSLCIVPALQRDYQHHSAESARLLKRSMPLDDEFSQAIEQVHEQADGSGYPRGLKAEETLEVARIVNVVDAYLSLSARGDGCNPYVASDVLAYLVYQTGKGKFDKNVMRALVKTFSMYPIGTMVRLDDDSCAIVVQANPRNPFQPVVRSTDATKRLKDLSVSPNYIVGPAMDGMQDRRRIEKGGMDQVLWVPVSMSDERN